LKFPFNINFRAFITITAHNFKKEKNMAGVNKVIIVGNLGGEPELKSIGNNKFVCNLLRQPSKKQ
jgi:hypothetical protein